MSLILFKQAIDSVSRDELSLYIREKADLSRPFVQDIIDDMRREDEDFLQRAWIKREISLEAYKVLLNYVRNLNYRRLVNFEKMNKPMT